MRPRKGDGIARAHVNLVSDAKLGELLESGHEFMLVSMKTKKKKQERS